MYLFASRRCLRMSIVCRKLRKGGLKIQQKKEMFIERKKGRWEGKKTKGGRERGEERKEFS